MLKHKLPPQQENNKQDKRIGLWLSSGLILIALAGIGIVKFTPQGQELSQKGILSYFSTHQPKEPTMNLPSKHISTGKPLQFTDC